MSTVTTKNAARLIVLRREFWVVTAVWFLFWLLSWDWLRSVWPLHANRWLLFSGITLLFGLRIIWNGLEENRRQGEGMLLTTLGWGNWLSIMRGLAICFVAGFLFSPWPQGGLGWIPVLLYTTADIADYFDGFIARRTNHATLLGERLDMEFDGLGMFIVSILGVWYGQLPWWYLLLGSARFFFLAGLWWRERQGLPIYELHPSVHRRLFAGFQMGFMSAVLWPIIPAAVTTIAGTLFAIPTALGFLRDWLVVSGRLDVGNGRYQKIQRWLVWFTRRWLPLALRLLLLICMSILFSTLTNWITPLPWKQLLQSWGVPIAGLITTLLGITGLLGTALLLTGTMGRLFSLLMVFPIGFDIASQGLTWANGTALGCVVCLMLLGTGFGSLWQPEEKFVLEKLG